MKFKGVIYDLDGILIDTEQYQYEGWVVPLRKFGVELSEDEYIRNYAGKSGPIIEEELIKKHKLKMRPGSLLHEKEKILMEWFSSRDLIIMPYVWEAIHFFQRNMPCVYCLLWRS